MPPNSVHCNNATAMDFKFNNLRRMLKRQKSSKASPVPSANSHSAEPQPQPHRSQNNRPVTANSAAPTPTGNNHHHLRETASLREHPSTNRLVEDLPKSQLAVAALTVTGSSGDSDNTSFETLAVTDRRPSKASTDAEYLRHRELDNRPALVLQTPTPVSEDGGRGEAGIKKIEELNDDSATGYVRLLLLLMLLSTNRLCSLLYKQSGSTLLPMSIILCSTCMTDSFEVTIISRQTTNLRINLLLPQPLINSIPPRIPFQHLKTRPQVATEDSRSYRETTLLRFKIYFSATQLYHLRPRLVALLLSHLAYLLPRPISQPCSSERYGSGGQARRPRW